MKNFPLPRMANLTRRCSRRVGWVVAALLICGTGASQAALDAYDAAIAADKSGGLTPVAVLTNAVTLSGTNGIPFDFGANSADVTMEFILEGNPAASTVSAFLAVGTNRSSSLRYEQYNNTAQLGFTQGGVADYMFTPALPSPSRPTHVTYVWTPAELTMRVYINGALAGTLSDVSDTFAMPNGAGFLGANPTGTEAMVGKIHRVTVYDEIVSDEAILRHAQAFKAEINPALAAYDSAILADSQAPLASLTNAVVLTGTAGVPFDFGASSGDATMEFILEGDPVATGGSGYIGVGENSTSSLRYEQWQNTLQLGFTQGGVADYLFIPAAPSPTFPTHIAYVWNATELSMKLYVNGVLVGTVSSVSDAFSLPAGLGSLGANATGAEAMMGIIYRVAVYDDVLSEAAIKRHADAFTSVLRPPIISSFTATPTEILGQGSVALQWSVQNATAVYLNNTNVTSLTNVTVSPRVTTTYTLAVSNSLAVVSSKVTVTVNPILDPYDARIAADVAAGLTPVASLTNAVSLTGAGGAPFDFGANSGDVTIEFILEGDPNANGASGYLAVGENASSSLRYDQWNNTGQIGFTQGGVADYMFNPAVPSPTFPTHLAFVWNATDLSMKVYVNGLLGGTVSNVSDTFAMPAGMGWLGATAGGGETMVGKIHRIFVYDDILPEEAIKRHADAFTSVLRPPIISSFTATPNVILGQGSSTLRWEVQNATAVYLNNADVTAFTNQTVSPQVTTLYTLVASNAIASVSSKVTVTVDPLLDAYDAAITADAAANLTPLAVLTNAVTLTGAGGAPFDFGASSGDVTIEFILEGDPVATGASGYLAVGEVADSNLRYDQWDNTAQIGFTQLRVADYMFTPAVSSPTRPTHLTYVWNAAEFSMTIYTNGVQGGVATGVSDLFVMPSGMGFLGANPAGGEAMVGRIHRVVVYDEILPEAAIQRHAKAFAGAGRGPTLTVDAKGSLPAITLNDGVAGNHYRIEYRNSMSTADSWQLLQDIPSLSGTSIRVEDPTPKAGRSERYYRAVVVP